MAVIILARRMTPLPKMTIHLVLTSVSAIVIVSSCDSTNYEPLRFLFLSAVAPGQPSPPKKRLQSIKAPPAQAPAAQSASSRQNDDDDFFGTSSAKPAPSSQPSRSSGISDDLFGVPSQQQSSPAPMALAKPPSSSSSSSRTSSSSPVPDLFGAPAAPAPSASTNQ